MLLRILRDAIVKQVSDVHFTYKDKSLSIQMREMSGMVVYEEQADVRIVSYLRYLSRLDLSRGHLPQTGHLSMVIDGQDVSLRFAYMSTNHIETGVLRLLNQSLQLSVEQLSTIPSQVAWFKRVLKRSHGLILLSGPTGCGKSTTLYTMLDYIKSISKKNIMTLEDPIEVHKEDMIQIQVNESQNLSYAEGLRQMLRHDPDVIMIGEIRDAETAKMVIRCALTGHLVLSTIHAKDCLGVIARMQELGVSTTNLMQTLIGITNQRIFKTKAKRGKVCIYEIMEEEHMEQFFSNQPTKQTKLVDGLQLAVQKGIITKKEATKEAMFLP